MAKVKIRSVVPTGMWVVAELFSEDPEEGPVGEAICTKVIPAHKLSEESLREFSDKVRLESN